MHVCCRESMSSSPYHLLHAEAPLYPSDIRLHILDLEPYFWNNVKELGLKFGEDILSPHTVSLVSCSFNTPLIEHHEAKNLGTLLLEVFVLHIDGFPNRIVSDELPQLCTLETVSIHLKHLYVSFLLTCTQ